MTTTIAKWVEIWESEEYQAEIYDNCTMRVYQHTEKPDKLKVEIDGTQWVGNTGGFHVQKYFLTGNEAEKLCRLIEEFDEDEASETDVCRFIAHCQ